MINRVILVGRLTRDVEVRKTTSGLSVATFTVACNRRQSANSQDRQADFISCVAWRQTADFLASYAKKGNLVGVEGRIQTRNYDGSDGKKVYVTEVVCDSVQLLTPRSSDNNSYTPSYTQAPVENNYEPSESFDDFTSGVSLDISSDDLPF